MPGGGLFGGISGCCKRKGWTKVLGRGVDAVFGGWSGGIFGIRWENRR